MDLRTKLKSREAEPELSHAGRSHTPVGKGTGSVSSLDMVPALILGKSLYFPPLLSPFSMALWRNVMKSVSEHVVTVSVAKFPL